MLQSRLFTRTSRFAPKDEESVNASLLIRAGYLHKPLSGAYELLPLGLRVFSSIVRIIREEMDAIGGQEILMTTLQERDVWEATGRWDDAAVDVWFKTKLKNDAPLGLATTHEEPITALMKQYVSSYRDLPIYAYQFQTKFRNELRARSGLLRCREFVMKDLYSFSRTAEEHERFYETVKQAYMRIFRRVGIGAHTFLTFASGGSFSKYSHEFQTVVPAGEDTVYLARKKKIAVNKEVLTDEVLSDLGLSRGDLEEVRAIEVGNIFPLGTRFSDALGLTFKDESGASRPVVMGSYGIGPGRLMGTIVELMHDDRGIVWPDEIAPFRVHLIELPGASGKDLYRALEKRGVSVLFDDRRAGPGEKFADADLIGIPFRMVVSAKTGAKVEIKRRSGKAARLLAPSSALKAVSA